MASTQHDRFASEDYMRLNQLGIRVAREGLRWHLIEQQPGVYDFASALQVLDAAQRHDIQVIWDLVHFGWPAHLDPFERSWGDSLAELAYKFGRLLRETTNGPSFIAAVNEISFLSWAGGDTAYLNPFAVSRGGELKACLAAGAIGASKAIRSELPQALLVAPEPVIHIAGDPLKPGDVEEAAHYRNSMFEAWDTLIGRVRPDLGGEESLLDIIGVNFYDRNQWWNHGKTIWRHQPEYRPFREILGEVHQRYQRPVFVSETGTENDERPHWCRYVLEETLAARDAGVDVHGICLYPILNHPGWDDDRHCYNGLWDYADSYGEREIYQPLADVVLQSQL